MIGVGDEVEKTPSFSWLKLGRWAIMKNSRSLIRRADGLPDFILWGDLT
jgi:hypothetical protein